MHRCRGIQGHQVTSSISVGLKSVPRAELRAGTWESWWHLPIAGWGRAPGSRRRAEWRLAWPAWLGLCEPMVKSGNLGERTIWPVEAGSCCQAEAKVFISWPLPGTGVSLLDPLLGLTGTRHGQDRWTSIDERFMTLAQSHPFSACIPSPIIQVGGPELRFSHFSVQMNCWENMPKMQIPRPHC